MKTNKLPYLGFIRVGSCGSSWAYGATPRIAATAAAEIRNRDWKLHLDLDEPFKVRVYKNPESGWYADDEGIYADGGTPLTLVEIVQY